MILLDLDIGSTDRWRSLPFAVRVDSGAYLALEAVGADTRISIPIDDSAPGTHTIEFILLDKPLDYTTITNGEITQDVLLKFHSLRVASLDILHLVIDQARYRHSNNGATELEDHKFSGTLGCRGSVLWTVQFPFFLWLLEHY